MAKKQDFPDLIQLTRYGMGNADEELQIKLLDTYFTLILEGEYLPKVITLYTEAVKLITLGSPLLDQFQALEDKGVLLISCGTCLNHYGLWDKVEVGLVGGMTDIIETQKKAHKIVSL